MGQDDYGGSQQLVAVCAPDYCIAYLCCHIYRLKTISHEKQRILQQTQPVLARSQVQVQARLQQPPTSGSKKEDPEQRQREADKHMRELVVAEENERRKNMNGGHGSGKKKK